MATYKMNMVGERERECKDSTIWELEIGRGLPFGTLVHVEPGVVELVQRGVLLSHDDPANSTQHTHEERCSAKNENALMDGIPRRVTEHGGGLDAVGLPAVLLAELEDGELVEVFHEGNVLIHLVELELVFPLEFVERARSEKHLDAVMVFGGFPEPAHFQQIQLLLEVQLVVRLLEALYFGVIEDLDRAEVASKGDQKGWSRKWDIGHLTFGNEERGESAHRFFQTLPSRLLITAENSK